MVNPLILLAIFLGFAFIFPLFEKMHIRVGRVLALVVIFITALIPLSWIYGIVIGGENFIYVGTAGLHSAFTINVAAGFYESLTLFVINILGVLILYTQVCKKERFWHGKQIILFVVVLLGANGLVLTRDIFNIFVFMEISSISLFGLLSMSKDERVFEGGFKYMLATGLSSVFYLVGAGLFYIVAGTLNLDIIPDGIDVTSGIIGKLWPVFILSGLFIELKPAFANGWAMDTYEASDKSLGAIMSGIQATAFVIVITKLITVIKPEILIPVLLVVGSVSFIVSQIQALTQTSFNKMLAYSSSGQIGLVLMVLGARIPMSGAIVLLISHAIAKTGLFLVGEELGEKFTGFGKSSVISARNRPVMLLMAGVFILALLGLPPLPAFGAKWSIIQQLGHNHNYITLGLILLGSLLEGAYLFRWFGLKAGQPSDKGDILGEKIPEDSVKNSPKYSSDKVIGETSNTSLVGRIGAVKTEFTKKSFHHTQISMFIMMIAVLFTGVFINITIGLPIITLIPFGVIILFGILDLFKIPVKVQVAISIGFTIYYGFIVTGQLTGIRLLFALMFLVGIAVQLIGFFTRKGQATGLMAMVTGLMVSLVAVTMAKSNFELFFAWEMMTLTSYFLVLRGDNAKAGAYRYIVFSLLSAFLLLAGLAMLNGAFIGNIATSSGSMLVPKILIIVSVMIKLANLGFHIWMPSTYSEAENDISSLFSSVLSKVGLFILFIGGVMFSEKIFGNIDIMYILGWIGALSALAGSLMALFQEDIKYTLAYSSMGQVGYMVLGFAVMSHLGWISSLYLATTHLMFKAMLFLSVAGVIYRTGTRLMYQQGGLIKKMPFSFVSALFAIIAVSGVPPLSGFGAKWLMYSSLLEKGWYLQAAVAMFASGVAFLYLFRLIHSIFLGQEKAIYRDVKEAPVALLIPQYIFMIAVMVVSMFPNILLKPLQEVINPYFASTVSWNGYEVISSLGYWNGNAVMYVTMGVFIIPLIWILVVNGRLYKVKQFNIVYSAERPYKPETTHYAYNFFGHYQKALGVLVEPWTEKCWATVRSVGENFSGALRRWNSGNAQGYAFQILMYLVFIYLIMGGRA